MSAPGEVRITAPLRWHDIDALGHVNHTVYHELMEETRHQLLTALVGENSMFVIVRVELDYKLEVRRTEEYVELTGRVESVGSKSVTIFQQIIKPDGRVAADGRAILVAFDMAERRAREITADERAALSAS